MVWDSDKKKIYVSPCLINKWAPEEKSTKYDFPTKIKKMHFYHRKYKEEWEREYMVKVNKKWFGRNKSYNNHNYSKYKWIKHNQRIEILK